MTNFTKTLLLFCFSLVVIPRSVAQVELEGSLKAGPEDASKYLKNYMEPGILSFANGLANGWVNTAKTHKLLGVDITFSVNLGSIPKEAYSFAYGNAAGWSNLRLASGDGNLPTVVGGNSDNQLFIRADAVITDPKTGESISYTADSDNFSAARGLDVSDIPFAGVPTPTLNIGMGLMKNTDLKIRYMPSINAGGFAVDMFGIGVMHDIKQWIPGLKLMPFDLAGFVGTTSMNVKIGYEFEQPSSGGEPDDTDVFYTDGRASTEFKVSSTTVQLLISKKLSVFTPYASVGYNIVSSNLDVKGTYVYANDLGEELRITDPVSLEFGGGSSPRVTVGGQLKLLVLTLHADYTIQKYNTFTAGVGISVR